MDLLVTNKLMDILLISTTLSIILMSIVQKFKSLSFVQKSWQIVVINFILAFAIGIPFSIIFYNQNLIYSIWISFFGFIGAPGIYEVLKKQNIINYTPKSLSEKKAVIEVPINNKINRE